MEAGSEDLASFFRSQTKDRRPLSDNLIRFYWEVMLEAVQALHRIGMCYRNSGEHGYTSALEKSTSRILRSNLRSNCSQLTAVGSSLARVICESSQVLLAGVMCIFSGISHFHPTL